MSTEGGIRNQAKRRVYSLESSQETETTLVNMNRENIKNCSLLNVAERGKRNSKYRK